MDACITFSINFVIVHIYIYIPEKGGGRKPSVFPTAAQWRFVLLGTLLALMLLVRPKHSHKSRLHLSSRRHSDTEP